MERAVAFDRLPVEILSVGKWNGDDYTLADLQDIEKNFYRLHKMLVPVLKFGHSAEQTLLGQADGDPALGQISDLRLVGDKLIATLSGMPEIVQTAIEKKLYTNVSCEIAFGAKVDGESVGKVLTGVALLGADLPAVNNLAGLGAYLKLDPARFADAMKHAQRKTLSYQPERKETPVAEPTALELAQAEIKKLTDAAAAASAQRTADAAELDRLRKAGRENAFNAERGKIITWADAQVLAKHILPAAREKIDGILSGQKEAFMAGTIQALSLSVEQVQTLMDDMLKAKLPATGELALSGTTAELSADGSDQDPADELTAKVQEAIDKAGGLSKLSFDQATFRVLSADRKLAARYQNSRNAWALLGERELNSRKQVTVN